MQKLEVEVKEHAFFDKNCSFAFAHSTATLDGIGIRYSMLKNEFSF